ncbi:CBO0543 family protein [Ammoniphilus sp. YIM 78166]|uniref:CBO0543 family protein n=1 Tax=Ammoniphilus sp. YIM 78166 TaxID=1644106 RepID=UPI00106FD093|nr:CBO0543 family protein [Ammoniphilus sp. YIM 78166]
MVTILVFIFSWLMFGLLADKKRIPELFPTALFSAFLGLLTDLIMEEYRLWSYVDKPLSGLAVPLVLDFGIYPVVSYLFIQGLPLTIKKRIIWTFFWSLGAILLEYIYLQFGIIRHHLWWNLWMSYLSDWIIFGLIILQYQFYAKEKVRQ